MLYNVDGDKMEELINLLIKKGQTISVMESCTGGGFCNGLTNIPNASKVFSYGAVTYSNLFKIKMGVSKEVIDQYGVYSEEVALDMARSISIYANSDYGVGITGKLKKRDDNNLNGDDDMVYVGIYVRDNDYYYHDKIKLLYNKREENKEQVINIIVDKIKDILNNYA